MEKYVKVLHLMQSKPSGRVELSDPDLEALLGRLTYRVATYMSCIRRLSKLEVRAVRNGRKVIAYELAALASPSQEIADPVQSPADTPSAPAAV